MSELNQAAAPEATVTEVKVVLTAAQKRAAKIELLTKRIAADTETLNALILEDSTAARLSSVGAGTVIVATVGRAETRRDVVATVLGKKEDESGAVRFKISYGEGFEADTAIIQPSQIVEVRGGEVLAQPTPVADVPAVNPVDPLLPVGAVGTDDFGRAVDAAGNVIPG